MKTFAALTIDSQQSQPRSRIVSADHNHVVRPSVRMHAVQPDRHSGHSARRPLGRVPAPTATTFSAAKDQSKGAGPIRQERRGSEFSPLEHVRLGSSRLTQILTATLQTRSRPYYLNTTVLAMTAV